MFFHISQQPQENYPCQWQLGSFAVSTDPGWKQLAIGPVQILYKGYADAGSLESLLGQVMFQSIPQLTGNFCALVVVNDTLTIQSDRYRGFPIYINDTGINNLVATDRTAWTDSLITMHADLSVTENKFDVIGNIDTGHSTVDDIDSLLSKKNSTVCTTGNRTNTCVPKWRRRYITGLQLSSTVSNSVPIGLGRAL